MSNTNHAALIDAFSNSRFANSLFAPIEYRVLTLGDSTSNIEIKTEVDAWRSARIDAAECNRRDGNAYRAAWTAVYAQLRNVRLVVEKFGYMAESLLIDELDAQAMYRARA